VAEKIDYEPTEAEAAVLLSGTQDATAEAGAIGGALGSAIGGGGGGGGGGARGGRAGARLTRARTAMVTLDVPEGPDEVRRRAREALAESGEVIEDPNAAGDGSVWGLVASGAMNLTVAVVRVGVLGTGADGAAGGGSRVEVRGTGREGLIPQKIGAKAADRIAGRLTGS
jgi:hypothetical protein